MRKNLFCRKINDFKFGFVPAMLLFREQYFFSIVKNFEKHYQKLFFNSDRFFEKFLLLKSNSCDLEKSRLRFFITLLALKLAQQNEKEIQLYDGSFLPLCIGWSFQYANFITDEYAFAKRKVVWAISGFFKILPRWKWYFAAIIIKATATFASKPTGFNIFDQQRARAIFGIRQAIMQHMHNRQADIKTDKIRQF